jgi:hypothetical protein
MELTNTGVLWWSQKVGRFLPREAEDTISLPLPCGYIALPSVENLGMKETIVVSEASQCIGQMAH